ncbi:hypothetical protein, partial [Putridiphycobacter roseus]
KNRINLILVASGYSLVKDEHFKEGIETRVLHWCNQKANNTIQLIWDGKENWFYLGEFDSLDDLNLSEIQEIAVVPIITTKKFFRKKYANKIVDNLISAVKQVLAVRKKEKDIYVSKINSSVDANSKLTFERKFTGRNPESFYGTTSYIDFIINGTSLSEILGGIGENIGKFGWRDNLDIELGEIGDLRSSNSTWLENGFHSIYVCSECADEGCGAYMFRIIKKDSVVIWTDFIFGDGYEDTDDNPDDNIDIEPVVFVKEEYDTALNELEKLLTENKNE